MPERVNEIIALPPIGYELIEYCADVAEMTGRNTRYVLREVIHEKMRRMASRRSTYFNSLVKPDVMRHWITNQYVWSYLSLEPDEHGHLRNYRRVDPRQIAWYRRLEPSQKNMLTRECKKHGLPVWKAYYCRLELPWIYQVIQSK
jgi:hypothetical protein